MSEPRSPDNSSLGKRVAAAVYLLFPLVAVWLLQRKLRETHFPGGTIYPPHFRFFSSLFHYQEALFVGLLFAIAGLMAVRMRNRWLRFLFYLPVALWFVWLMVWVFVRNGFRIQLSPWYVWDIVRHPSAVAGVGIRPSVLYPEVAGLLLIVFLIAIAGAWLVHKVTNCYATLVVILYLIVFLGVHIPVRAYIVSNANRGDAAIMHLDDFTPVPLRTEFLFAGLRTRLDLPNLENKQRNNDYVEYLRHLSVPQIPRKIDIVWIVIESFRADAIDQNTAPYLWNHRDEFQLKLDQNHWSGGNCSQFGLFSMFTGVSGYHLQTFIRGGAYVPFFRLLQENGYEVRIANRHYFDESGKFRSFLPPTLNGPSIEDKPDTADEQMTKMLLSDMNSRKSQHSLDIIPFDSTHWPFYYPAEDRIFQPAPDKPPKGVHVTKTRAEVTEAHNRFRNSCHFVDREIGKIIEALRAKNALDHTIVIICGDHGEEFMERGKIFHGGPLDDFQGRPVLWMHFPEPIPSIDPHAFTSHIDIIATLLECFGFEQDILRTQGQSLLHPRKTRKALLVSESGYYFPYYSGLVTDQYITRWRTGSNAFSFAGVARRDGERVVGEDWRKEALNVYPEAAAEYEILPDTAAPLPNLR